ncbi:winged helix domain-containing protein [Mesorhizobium australafricanum]|uniref:Winged helix domain-containing protein n=1 Tax=Mesorhizobium australafricanum TaxID=3072311 RepID=A0ABU4WQM5_9HYPH|nr:hypothetical protein [Mesorhizobium sp. VK3E]MDX8438332.1 hypothetical protein [Mesorhizobium sp. VK3E]
MKKFTIVVKVEPDGQPVRLDGRSAWMMKKLVEAGKRGVSTIDLPAGVRVAHYIFLLRRAGFVISTEHASHGGLFSGVHAVYRIESPISILEDIAAAA